MIFSDNWDKTLNTDRGMLSFQPSLSPTLLGGAKIQTHDSVIKVLFVVFFLPIGWLTPNFTLAIYDSTGNFIGLCPALS